MIVVPDDFPSVFDGSAAQDKARALGAVRVYTERGADDENELVRRIGDAKVAISAPTPISPTRCCAPAPT